MAEEDPRQLRRQENSKNKGKWARYKGKWYNPLEWVAFRHSNLDGIDRSLVEYKHANQLLQEAQQTLLTRSSMGENITPLLVRYFEFEKKVMEYMEIQIGIKENLPF